MLSPEQRTYKVSCTNVLKAIYKFKTCQDEHRQDAQSLQSVPCTWEGVQKHQKVVTWQDFPQQPYAAAESCWPAWLALPWSLLLAVKQLAPETVKLLLMVLLDLCLSCRWSDPVLSLPACRHPEATDDTLTQTM